MPYIKRDSNNRIVGVARHPTEGFHEYSDSWPELAKSPAAERDEALAAMVHDFGDGRVIQCRPQDERNLRNAIERLQRLGEPSQLWRMADNSHHPVTVAELQAALAAGQDQGAAIWGRYFSDLGGQ